MGALAASHNAEPKDCQHAANLFKRGTKYVHTILEDSSPPFYLAGGMSLG